MRSGRLLSFAVTLGCAAGLVMAPAASAKANAVDRAFNRQMVPHHEMATEMAQMAVERADHARLRGLAKRMIEDQGKESRALRRIARRIGITPAEMPSGGESHEQMMRDAETLGLTMEEMSMSMDMDALEAAKPFDRTFIDMMITHHQGAIRMARAEIEKGRDAQLRRIARDVVEAQAREIRTLNSWRKQWYDAKSPSGGVPKASSAIVG